MSYASVWTRAPLATVASITGRIVACCTLASMRTATRPPRCSSPRSGGFSFSSVPRPGAALSRRRRPGRPFGNGRRLTLVAGHDVDLVDLDLAIEDHRRCPGGQPLPERLGHALHVRDGEV